MIIFHDRFILNTYCLVLPNISQSLCWLQVIIYQSWLTFLHRLTGYGQERWTMSTYFCFSYYLHIQLWQKWEKLQTSPLGNMKSKCTLKNVSLETMNSFNPTQWLSRHNGDVQASLFILGYTGASVLIGPVLSCSVDYNQAEKRVLQAVISCLWRYRGQK